MFKIRIFTDFSKQPRCYCPSYSLMFEPSAGVLWRHPTSKWKLLSKSVYRLRDEWSYGGVKLTGKTNVLVDKPGVVPLRPPQIQYWLIRDQNLTSAVRGRELTATARTSKSNGQDFCFVFGGTGFKVNIPKKEEKANMLTEIVENKFIDAASPTSGLQFSYISLQ